jgi:hypothetical protein
MASQGRVFVPIRLPAAPARENIRFFFTVASTLKRGHAAGMRTRMLLRHRLAVLTFIGLLAIGGIAQEKSAAAKPSPLEPVAWLVGGTWVTDIKNPQNDSTIHVENNINWAPNHQAIDFLTKFNGQPHYNGFYAYNAAAKAISFYYTSSQGDLTIGTAAPDADGKTLHQEFDLTSVDGRVTHIRSTLVRDGDNAYWFTVFLQKNGEWSPEFKIHYERK